MAGEYVSAIASEIEHSEYLLPMYSTVTGEKINLPSELNAAYWSQNLTSTVEFNKTVRKLLQDNSHRDIVFIEIGPHKALQGPLRQIIDLVHPKSQTWYIPTLLRCQDAEETVLRAAGMAWVRGIHIEPAAINGSGRTVHSLPRYPWYHSERHWSESRISENWRLRKFPHHELLGSRVLETSSLYPHWRNLLQIHDSAWLSHHKLFKDIVFPCAGYVAMIGEAIRQHCGCDGYEIKNLVLKKPLFLQETTATEILTSLIPERLSDIADSEWFEFTILALDGPEWSKYCHGYVRSADPNKSPTVVKQPPWARKVIPKNWYQLLNQLGLKYGPSFQRMQSITVDPVEHVANATVQSVQADVDGQYFVHPTLIDQCLQLLSVAAVNGLQRHATSLAIPASIDLIRVTATSGNAWLQAETDSSTSSTRLSGHVSMLSDSGSTLVMTGATFMSLANDDGDDENPVPLLSQIDWAPCLDLDSPQAWLPFEDKDRGVSLVAELTCCYMLEAASQVQHAAGATDHLKKYQRWLAKVNSQLKSGTTQRFLHIPWNMMTKEERMNQAAELRRQLSLYGAEVQKVEELLRLVAQNCHEIVTGELSALEILSIERLRALYEFGSSLTDLSPFLRSFAHWNPRARILEIGAGTGATCAQVIGAMKPRDGKSTFQTYTFTDISPIFLSAAAERWGQEERIEFKKLDITRDPEEQGFLLESYDLVIASNVGWRDNPPPLCSSFNVRNPD